MGKYAGKSKLALRPKSTEQVSKVLAYCNDRRLAIVPQVKPSWAPASKPAQLLDPEMALVAQSHIGAGWLVHQGYFESIS